MVHQVRDVAPIYGSFLGPSCVARGACPEGKESCKLKRKKNPAKH
jgi:hypothetical protein